MPKLSSLPVIAILLLLALSGCGQNSASRVILTSPAIPNPTNTVLHGDTYSAVPTPGNKTSTSTASPYPDPTTTPTNSTTETPTQIPTLTLTPTPTLFPLPQPLPSPLYFITLAEENVPQVWRMERDGLTVTQITHEAEGVTALDLAGDGRLAYISNNTMISTDAWGSQRKVLVQGDLLPLSDRDNEFFKEFIEFTTPVWSPDGKQIAFSMGETWLVLPENGELIQVTGQKAAFDRRNGMMFIPIGWTADGEKIIVKALPPSAGGFEGFPPAQGMGFVDPKPDSIPLNRGGLGCNETCEFSLLKNGQVLLGGGPLLGYGLWIVDPQTGNRKYILSAQHLQDGNFPRIRWPKQSPDNRVLFFVYAGTEEKYFLELVSINDKPLPLPFPKGVTAIGQTDSFMTDEALWSADAQMVVFGYGGLHNGHPGNILLMSALDGTVTQLNVTGYNFRWGTGD